MCHRAEGLVAEAKTLFLGRKEVTDDRLVERVRSKLVRAGFDDRPAELTINLKIAKALGLTIPIATPAGRSRDSVSEQRPFLDRHHGTRSRGPSPLPGNPRHSSKA